MLIIYFQQIIYVGMVILDVPEYFSKRKQLKLDEISKHIQSWKIAITAD